MWRLPTCPHSHQHLVSSEFSLCSAGGVLCARLLRWCLTHCNPRGRWAVVIHHYQFLCCLQSGTVPLSYHPRVGRHRDEKTRSCPHPVFQTQDNNQDKRPEQPTGLLAGGRGKLERGRVWKLGSALWSHWFPASWPILLGLTGIPAVLQLLFLPSSLRAPGTLLIQKKDGKKLPNAGEAFP